MENLLLNSEETNDATEEKSEGKVYLGIRLIFDEKNEPRGRCAVSVNGEPLKSVLIPDERAGIQFEWGSMWGSGCVNLAISILSDMFRSDFVTPVICRKFRRDFVAKFEFDGWELKESELEAWLDRCLIERKRTGK